MVDYLRELVRHKRSRPADDLLSDLITTTDLTEEELTNIAFLLLVAGHESTANMIALGVFALLRHPTPLAKIHAEPAMVESAVEELLRYLTIVHFGPTRAALQDVELEGQLIRKGESVAIGLAAANRDPAMFAEPGTLCLDRPDVRRHLAFGYGAPMPWSTVGPN